MDKAIRVAAAIVVLIVGFTLDMTETGVTWLALAVCTGAVTAALIFCPVRRG